MNTSEQSSADVKPAVATKQERNATSLNPKKNPARRRPRSTVEHPVIGTYALKPKRDLAGRPIPGRTLRFWGGRKPSKYDPAKEAAKHAAAKKGVAA